ncbi:transcription termination/antitermination protein NusA [bacterium]|nr:transcription termination/antitermination protein NusA [candidate division CSSED10-310 bacterium]
MNTSGLEILQIIDQMGRERGIDREVLIEAIEASVVQAAKRHLKSAENLEAHFNRETGKIELYTLKTVVENVTSSDHEISLDKAREIFDDVEPGEEIEIRRDFDELGRIAAQTAKQVIVQRVREAERDIVFDHFKDKIHELVNGIVLRTERGNIYIDLTKGEAVLPRTEQSPRDRYHRGDRIRAYLKEVKHISQGPQLVLSRADTGLIIKLFEMEVPEIYEGIVEIKSCVREPGGRSKICVTSHDHNVDPVGACVGIKGARVQAVVRELRGENIDIIAWTEDPVIFISNALSPAQVNRVELNPFDHTAIAVVADDQLSLAIGKKGQNVRLAAKLTGWKIEIKSESDMEKAREIRKQKVEAAVEKFKKIPEISESVARFLTERYLSYAQLADGDPEWIAQLPNVGPDIAKTILEHAEASREFSAEEDEDEDENEELDNSSEYESSEV